MLDSMAFWMRRGVAGFRLDAVNYMYVDDKLRDNPYVHPDDFNEVATGKYTFNLPELHETLRAMRRVVESGPEDGVLIAETNIRQMDALLTMYGKAGDEVQLPMNFNLFWSDFSAETYRRELGIWEGQKAGWPLLFFSNHDFPWSFTRLGDGTHNAAMARVLATLLLTARGTPVVYYGEELGMAQGDADAIRAGGEHLGCIPQPPFDQREGARTPMQWTDGPQAGFSTGAPWLPVQSNRAAVNAASEKANPSSLLNLYRTLIRLRQLEPALTLGSFEILENTDAAANGALCYLRRSITEGR